MITETKCSDHPDAQRGFDRNGSHMAGHYVCECSGWVPPKPKSLQDRLRDGADICYARNIQLDYAKVAEEAADRIDDLTAKLDQYRTEYFQALRERDEYRKCADDAAMAHKIERDALMNDKEVLLGHMETIRNVTNDPAISNLAKVVLERMEQGGMK